MADNPAPYQRFEMLGQGEAGSVYRARAPDGRIVALKLLYDAEAERPSTIRHLAAEVALSRQLSHPGLVSLLDSGMWDGRPFLAMELIDGPTLEAEMIKQRLPLARSLPIVVAAAGTLAVLHAADAIHRDIKPSNIMLRGGTDPVVMDLGIAALGAVGEQEDGDLVGSPGYLAPEIIDDRPFDGKADVFALGVVLYMLITDRRPFDGSVDAVMDKIRREAPLPPSTIDPALPRALDGIIDRALAKDPRQRYAASDLAAALRAI
jgi:serine/threonine-protein kinase